MKATLVSRTALAAFPVFLFIFSLTFLFDGDRFDATDARDVYRDAEEILWGARPVTKYPPGYTALLLPVVAAEWALFPNDWQGGEKSFLNDRFFALPFSMLAGGVAALMVFVLLRLGFSLEAAAWLALLCGAGTILMPYGSYSFSEIAQCYALLGAFHSFLVFHDDRRRKRLLLCGLCVGIAGLMKPNLLLLSLVFAAGMIASEGWRNARRWLLDGLLFAAPVALLAPVLPLYNYWRSGNLLDFGYRGEGFPTWLIAGVYGQLFSPGKSMFLYSPVLIAAFWGWGEFIRTRRLFAWLCLGAFAGLVLLYAKWWTWAGELSWGPRFTVPLTPLVFLPAAFALRRFWRSGSWRRRAAAALCAVSAAYQIFPASVAHFAFAEMNATTVLLLTSEKGLNLIDALAFNHFVPESSPIIGAPWLFTRAIAAAPSLRSDRFGRFSAKFDGRILIPDEPGLTMRAALGGQIAVSIDGERVIDSITSRPGVLTASLESIPKGWRPIEIKYKSGKTNAYCALEWKSPKAPGYRKIAPEFFRREDGAPSLTAKYYHTAEWRGRIAEKTAQSIDFDWRQTSPFDEWLLKGFPPGWLYYDREPGYPKRQLWPWMFYIRPWPMKIYYQSPRGSDLFEMVALLTAAVALLAYSLISLIALTRRPETRNQAGP